MKYYTLHIRDSGAIENIEGKKINGKPTLICEMYTDSEFNKMNDILHSSNDYILNKKALDIFLGSKTIPYELKNATVIKRQKFFVLFRKIEQFNYYQLEFPNEHLDKYYNWIDFELSEIYAIDNFNNKIKIRDHQQTLGLIKQNKTSSDLSFDFESTRIVFGKNFDTEIDFFKIPLYSFGEYVSERLKNRIESAGLTDLGFYGDNKNLGNVWKSHFPIIEFTK